MVDAHALLIVTDKSRTSNAQLAAGLKLLKDTGVEITEEVPKHPGQLPDLIRRYRSRVDRIIIGGGDGALNAAAEAMLESRVPLGILPLGTANDLARTLGIPLNLRKACEIIARGHLHEVDLGWVNGKHFFNAASIGLGALVTRKLSGAVKGKWGAWSYSRIAWDAFKGHRAFTAEITCDGTVYSVSSIHIAVGNGRFYGGGMAIRSDAAIDDHRLDLYSLEPQPIWKLIKLAPELKRGQQCPQEGFLVLKGREIDIHTHRPKWVSADGELTTRTPARFRVIPSALPIYVAEPRQG